MIFNRLHSTLSTQLKVAALVVLFTFTTNIAVAQVPIEGKKPAPIYVSHPGKLEDDLALVAAVQSKRNVHYVEGGNIVVTKIYPDDNQGLPHQSWEAQLSDKSFIKVVYNTNMGEYIPVQVGMTFSVGGQFIWTKDGGLIHWLHHDPKQKRPDGWVFIENILYGIPQEPQLPIAN